MIYSLFARDRFQVTFASQQRMPNAFARIHKFVSKPAPVTEEIAIHLSVIPVHNPPQRAVALPRGGVASQTAVGANRRRHLQVPFARIVLLESLVRKHTGGTHLDQVASEFALEHAVFGSAKEHGVAHQKRIQIVLAGVVSVIAHAPVALNTSIHLVIYERTEILIVKRAFLVLVAPVDVTRHHGHILQVALAAFVTDRAVMRMALHQPFNHTRAEGHSVRMFNGEASSFRRGPQAGHDQPPALVLRTHEQLHGTLPASSDRTQCRVPAEIRQV